MGTENQSPGAIRAVANIVPAFPTPKIGPGSGPRESPNIDNNTPTPIAPERPEYFPRRDSPNDRWKPYPPKLTYKPLRTNTTPNNTTPPQSSLPDFTGTDTDPNVINPNPPPREGPRKSLASRERSAFRASPRPRFIPPPRPPNTTPPVPGPDGRITPVDCECDCDGTIPPVC